MLTMLKSLVALAIGAALIAGCGPSGNSGGSSNSQSGGDGGAKTKVVFIPKDSGNPYFNRIEKGLNEKAGELGLEVSTQAPASAQATSQLSVIKDQVQRGVNVIVLASNSPDALNEVLDQARAKNVMVITVDSDLVGNEDHRDVGVLQTDTSQIGPSQIELLAKGMNYEGEFAILSATTDAPNQNAWIADMKEALKNPKYAKMKLVETVYGDDESQKSSTEAEALLIKHPNLKGILSPTSVGLSAAARVLENSGRYPGGPKAGSSPIILTGLSTPSEMKDAIDKGVVASFQLWDPADMGAIAAFIASKRPEIKAGGSFEVPGRGAIKIGDKNTIFAGSLVTFDKSNIGNYDF